ncbi:hypothetical protein HDV05_008691 [Chytridiales sp. JEL 0842]|nr:hypothetical protein HDV05_008691 [Chytridiales sp. JEL 0842]
MTNNNDNSNKRALSPSKDKDQDTFTDQHHNATQAAKKPKTESTSKSTSLKSTNQHYPDCKDPACEGCASGEVEIDFSQFQSSAVADAAAAKNPTPQDLYSMALDELSTPLPVTATNEEHDLRQKAITKILEMALDQLETLYPSLTPPNPTANSINNNKNLQKDEKIPDTSTRLLHAQCLREVSAHLVLEERLDHAVKCLRDLVVETPELGEAWVALGKGLLERMKLLRGLNDCLEDDRGGDDEDDDDDDQEDDQEEEEAEEDANEDSRDRYDDEEDKPKAKAERQEAELSTELRRVFSKALSCFESDPVTHALERAHIGRLLRNYALMVYRDSKKSPLSTLILTLALSLLSTEPNHTTSTDARQLPSATRTSQLVQGSCLYHLAKFTSAKGDTVGAAMDAKEATVVLRNVLKGLKAEAVTTSEDETGEMDNVEELLGQTYILLSTLTDDDEVALDSFERGAKCLKRVLKRCPGREKLRVQLEALGNEVGSEEEGDEESSEGDEEESGDEGKDLEMSEDEEGSEGWEVVENEEAE